MEWVPKPASHLTSLPQNKTPLLFSLLSGNEDSCCWLRGVMLQAGTKEASLRPAASLYLVTFNHLVVREAPF